MPIPDRLQPHALVHVQPAVTTDVYGDDVRNWTSGVATRTTFAGWVQQDQRGTEHDGARDQPSEQRWALITNYAGLGNGDRVEWTHPVDGSVAFEVWGPPEPAYQGGQGVHHYEATLRLWGG